MGFKPCFCCARCEDDECIGLRSLGSGALSRFNFSLNVEIPSRPGPFVSFSCSNLLPAFIMDNGRLANFMGLGSNQAAFYPSFVLPLALPFQVHISPLNGSQISPPEVVVQVIEIVLVLRLNEKTGSPLLMSVQSSLLA